MRISHQVIPPGGWVFKQGENIIRGQTRDELVRNVRTHRQSNGIELNESDLEYEIDDQIAEEHTQLIINGEKTKKKPMGVNFFHTVQSFAQFLLNFTLSGGQLVDQNTANIRAAICVACHNNKPSSEGKGCNTCNKGASIALNKIRDTIIKGRKTSSDAGLQSCGVCGCDMKIKVWIPNAVLVKTEEANAYPSFCWNKKVLEGNEV